MTDKDATAWAELVGGGLFVAVTLFMIFHYVGWSSPDTFDGDMPTVSADTVGTGNQMVPYVESKREARLGWTLTGGHATTTRLSVKDEQVARVRGTLRMEAGAGCPDAVVQWTLPPLSGPPTTHPPLTAAAPESESLEDYPLPVSGSPALQLELKRLDSTACEVRVYWLHASFSS